MGECRVFNWWPAGPEPPEPLPHGRGLKTTCQSRDEPQSLFRVQEGEHEPLVLPRGVWAHILLVWWQGCPCRVLPAQCALGDHMEVGQPCARAICEEL